MIAGWLLPTWLLVIQTVKLDCKICFMMAGERELGSVCAGSPRLVCVWTRLCSNHLTTYCNEIIMACLFLLWLQPVLQFVSWNIFFFEVQDSIPLSHLHLGCLDTCSRVVCNLTSAALVYTTLINYAHTHNTHTHTHTHTHNTHACTHTQHTCVRAHTHTHTHTHTQLMVL